MRANPGKYNYGSPGSGSPAHLTMAQIGATKIADLGPRNVLITRASGLYALVRDGHRTRRFRVEIDPVEPVSTVGSGVTVSAGTSMVNTRWPAMV